MPRPKNLELPALIKLTRLREGVRQADLARAIPVHRDTLSRYERGEACPPEDTANRISVALGLNEAERTAFLAAWQHDRRLWDAASADKAAERSRDDQSPDQAPKLEPFVLPDIEPDIPTPDVVSDSVPHVDADQWTPTWHPTSTDEPTTTLAGSAASYSRGSATPPPEQPPIDIHVNAPPPPQSRYTLRSRGGLMLLGFLVLAVVGAGAWWGLSAIRPSPVALVHVTSTPAPTAPATHALPTATATPGITPAATATPIPTPGDTPTAIVIPTAGPTPPAVTAAAGSWRVQLDATCKWSVWLSATGLQPGSTVTLDDPSYTATDCSGRTFHSGWPHPNDAGTADANGEWGAYGIVQPNWGTYHYVVTDAAGNVVNIDVVYDQNAGA